MMKVLGVIPSRYHSTRFPGKALADLYGKPMIWWVYQRAVRAKRPDEICVATDHEAIAAVCRKYEIPYFMTSSAHNTAAERLQEVSEIKKADFYLQLNGDEPLMNLDAVDAAVPDDVPSDREFGTNIITRITDPAQCIDPSNIKVVFDEQMNALYMSRSPIPYPSQTLDFHYYKHVGIIGFNKKMLDFYAHSKPGKLERIEGIDTLRFLDYGKELKFVTVENCSSLSVDTPKDLEIVRELMKTDIPSGGMAESDALSVDTKNNPEKKRMIIGRRLRSENNGQNRRQDNREIQ